MWRTCHLPALFDIPRASEPMQDQDEKANAPRRADEGRIPLVEESAAVSKRTVTSGRVRIRTVVDEHEELVHAPVTREEVTLERVPVGREVPEAPQLRHEGDVLIVPVVEEVLVIERRLVLKEELHIRKLKTTEEVEQPVTLRSTRAIVEREAGDDTTS